MYRYWGKLNNPGKYAQSNTQVAAMHLLVYHSLDVAACGERLLLNRPSYLNNILKAWGLSKKYAPAVQDLLIRLMALHDLGKFDLHFQFMYPDFQATLEGKGFDISKHSRIVGEYNAKANHHSVMGYRLWTEDNAPTLGTRWEKIENQALVNQIAGCFLAHHGFPPSSKDPQCEPPRMSAKVAFREDLGDRKAVREYLQTIEGLFGEHAFETEYQEIFTQEPKDEVLLNDYLNQLVTLADWLGSDSYHFSFVDTPMPLSEYWRKHAQIKAISSVQQTRLDRAVNVNPNVTDFKTLFGSITTLTDLQKVAWEQITPKEASLYLFEDVMGSGKTEAGLLLAYKCLAANLVQGAYFALPTRATTDGIYRRLMGTLDAKDLTKAPYLRNIFQGDPEVVLAHASARLSRDRAFLEQVSQKQESTDDQEGIAGTATSNRVSWLQSRSKVSLGADFGVGTIDQALMSILLVKHYTLRAAFLADKVLIIDEIHSYDSYTFELICKLIETQIGRGLPVIALTATLAEQDRKKLLVSAARGRIKHLGLTSSGKKLFTQGLTGLTEDFPAVTILDTLTEENAIVTGVPIQVLPVESPLRNQRKVSFQYSTEWCGATETAILDALKAGKCVCILLNTVKQAQFTLRQWKRKVNPLLIHARFTPKHRGAKEALLDKIAGKASTAKERAGQLIIATQVVEQSLDLDFDLMVTELAPIDSLLQRSGRVWRHLRDLQGNPLPKDTVTPVEGREGQATMIVVGPAKEEEMPDWEKGLGASAKIYHLCDLWRTMLALLNIREIQIPQDMRKCLDAVYSDPTGLNLPEAIMESYHEMRTLAGKSKMSALQGLSLNQAYGEVGETNEDEDAEISDQEGEAPSRENLSATTRKGVPTWNLRLITNTYTAQTEWQPLSGELPICESTPDATFMRKAHVAWEDSTVSTYQYNLPIVSKAKIRIVGLTKGVTEEIVKKLCEGMPDKGKFSLLVFGWRDSKGVFQTWVPSPMKGMSRKLFYSEELGLWFEDSKKEGNAV